MTTIRVGLVDVYVFRGAGEQRQLLLLRRARGPRAGSWEAVHGHIEPDEHPVDAAHRELAEETGCRAEALFNLSAVEQFYLHDDDTVMLIPVFAARVGAEAAVTIGREHDQFRWLSPADARRLCTWPRAVRAVDAIERLLLQRRRRCGRRCVAGAVARCRSGPALWRCCCSARRRRSARRPCGAGWSTPRPAPRFPAR